MNRRVKLLPNPAHTKRNQWRPWAREVLEYKRKWRWRFLNALSHEYYDMTFRERKCEGQETLFYKLTRPFKSMDCFWMNNPYWNKKRMRPKVACLWKYRGKLKRKHMKRIRQQLKRQLGIDYFD